MSRPDQKRKILYVNIYIGSNHTFCKTQIKLPESIKNDIFPAAQSLIAGIQGRMSTLSTLSSQPLQNRVGFLQRMHALWQYNLPSSDMYLKVSLHESRHQKGTYITRSMQGA